MRIHKSRIRINSQPYIFLIRSLLVYYFHSIYMLNTLYYGTQDISASDAINKPNCFLCFRVFHVKCNNKICNMPETICCMQISNNNVYASSHKTTSLYHNCISFLYIKISKLDKIRVFVCFGRQFYAEKLKSISSIMP